MGACAVLLGLALGSVQPMIMSTLHQITPHERHGEAIALRSMTINPSSTLMPLVFGVAGAALGAAALFWLMGAAVGAGSLAARHVRATPPDSRLRNGSRAGRLDRRSARRAPGGRAGGRAGCFGDPRSTSGVGAGNW